MNKLLRFFGLCLMVGMPLSVWAQTTSTFAKRLESYNKCWFCTPFGGIFDIANDITTESCKTLQPVFLSLLGIFFLFWLVIRVGRVVIDVTPNPDTQLVPDLLKQTLRVIVASLLLVFYTSAFYYIISPALELSIGVGNKISLQKIVGQQSSGQRSSYTTSSSTTETNLCPDYEEALNNETSETDSSDGKVFSDVTKEAFLCYIRVGNASLTTGMAIGATAIAGWAQANFYDKFRHADLFFIGAIFMGAYFLLMLAFPTKLFDPLLTLTFVAALFPLWVVLWTFQGTKDYYKKAQTLFIGVLVHLIVISVVTLMAVSVMNSALGDTDTQTRLFTRLLRGEDTYKVFTTTEGFGLSGKAVFLTLALAWLAYKILEKASPIAGQFEGIVDFGVNKGTAGYLSKAQDLTAEAGKGAVAATYYGTRGTWRRVASRDDQLGKAARGLGSIAMGTLAGAATAAFAPAAIPAALVGLAGVGVGAGTAAASHRFMPVPGNRPHSASWRDRRNVRKFEDENNNWLVNQVKGQSSRQDKRTKEWDKYDRNAQLYQEFDSAGRIQNEYDRTRGNISLGDKKYKFAVNASNGALTIEFDDQKYSVDINGNVKNEKTGVAVDETVATQVRDIADFQRHAERRISEHEGMLRMR